VSNELKVEKLNSVYIRISAEADIRRELSDYFSFEVPGYKFTPQLEIEFGMEKYDYIRMPQVKCM